MEDGGYLLLMHALRLKIGKENQSFNPSRDNMKCVYTIISGLYIFS